MKRLLANLPIAVKVLVAPVFVLLCLLGVAAVSHLSSLSAEQALEAISRQRLPALEAASELKNRTTELDAMVMRSLAYEAGGMKASRIQALDQKIAKELAEFKDRLGKLRSGADAAQAGHYAAIESAHAEYARSAKDTLEMKAGGVAEAAMVMTTAESAFAKLRKAVDALSAEIEQQAVRQAADATERLAAARQVSMAVLLAAVVVSVFVIVFSARQITRPLRETVRIARAIADGDLRFRHLEASKDETGQVLAAMSGICERMGTLLGGVQGAAHQIEGASSELATGNVDLSSRTEQTAAALQETASTVGQLTGRMKENSEATERANRLATRSAELAHEGGQVMREVVSSMEQINGQAKRIADIIAVIDGLSFQTNLLALNAAVEAARAGEMGRGFAVVAGEVRGLATRSAEAAKEIRALIETSVEQAGAGSQRVVAAESLIGQIVATVGDVSRLMEGIARANGEQVHGITQVSSAMARMDSTTQQNAALVEQAAAATQSLNAQTQTLRETLAVFQTA